MTIGLLPLSPLVKWPGGKRWQLPLLEAFWQAHTHRRLVEPFCGSAAIAFGLRPSRAWLNDLCEPLIACYLAVRDGYDLPTPPTDRESYDALRESLNALTDRLTDVAHADRLGAPRGQLFYQLNRATFNGLWRVNAKGHFNVPYGGARTHTPPDLASYRECLSTWVLSVGAFETLRYDPDDFIYADPPYDGGFTHYTPGGFSWDQQVQLAEQLAEHPGPVVLTNRATAEIVALYTRLGFELLDVEEPRKIACNGDRTPVPCVLAVRHL